MRVFLFPAPGTGCRRVQAISLVTLRELPEYSVNMRQQTGETA